MLKNDTIYLRAPEPEDIGAFYHWENDTSLWRYGSTISPFSRYILKEYIAEANTDIFQSKQLRLMIVLNENDRLAGMVDLFDFDPFHQRAAIGILIAPEFQGRGLASQALLLMEEYAFEFLGIRQLYAHVPRVNDASMKLFQKNRYEEAGILKDWLRINRKYEDVSFFQKIRSVN
ncbi:MAG: GNAT family protein [Bacteroidales bacterium]